MANNEFGYTAWGKDWIRLAEPLRQTRPEPLLPRARRVARNDGVAVTIDGHTVRASIHRGGQASVTYLEVEPMSRGTIETIGAVIGDPTVLTDDMHRAALAAGARLAPIVTATDCSCKARSPRCLHVLATYYDVARRVDDHPRLALEIQGYFQGGQPDSEAAPQEHRWIPISTLDPADYFAVAAPG
ncbi:hypothetical protein [Nocardia callitridis]|uniref:SWIM-type domain-containing protein n=1 Tax=Nocardia callitridis TaxID=648753 RepID=A0ABP9KBU1_9NOCA